MNQTLALTSADFIRDMEEIARNFEQLKSQAPRLEAAAAALTEAAGQRKKILLCGNGGSAADAQHLAAELTGRYERERQPYPALALTVDSSALTAIGNDYGFAEVFARQVRAYGSAGDVLIALSTSGRSGNVIAALKAARELQMVTIGFTGAEGREMALLCDHLLMAPARRTNRIQEMHIAMGHMLCGAIEAGLD
ncbi:MAG: SIS domain-containing protein [Alphaproteobacteria bacterium]|nr:SIS domain-containing protein [Alphaproteobacteria bacterium]